MTIFKQRGLLAAGGRQRTDATHVLAKVRALNRLVCVGETFRGALGVGLVNVDLTQFGWFFRIFRAQQLHTDGGAPKLFRRSSILREKRELLIPQVRVASSENPGEHGRCGRTSLVEWQKNQGVTDDCSNATGLT